MINEIWKEVVGYEGLYQVSNLGRVKALPKDAWNGKGHFKTKERILKVFLQKDYERVHLHKDGKCSNKRVHRLVAEAFIDNPENKPYVDHINTIRNDNRVDNLRWVTHKENMNNPLTIIKFKKN